MRRAQLREIDFSFISVCGSYVHSLDPFGRFCFKILLTNPALESTRVRVERTHADTYMDTIDAQAAPAPAAPASPPARLTPPTEARTARRREGQCPCQAWRQCTWCAERQRDVRHVAVNSELGL